MSILYNLSQSEIITNQNEKILSLTSELNKKDEIITSLKTRISLSESTLSQLETYKKEISLLSSKLELSKYDTESATMQLIEENNNLQGMISSLKTNLSSKDKKLKELIEIVSQYENQITNLNGQITNLNKNNKELKAVILDMSSNYQKACIKLSNEKEEKKTNEEIVYGIQYKKNVYESKIKELIELINQYSNEIEKINNELQSTKTNYLSLEEQYQKQTSFLNEITEEIQLLNKENLDLKEINQQLNKKLQLIENQNNEIRNQNYEIQKECNNLNNEISKKDLTIKKEEMKYNNLVILINKDIGSISKEIINVFSNIVTGNEQNDKGINLLSTTTINNAKSDINFDLLIKSINDAKDELDEYVNSIRYNNHNLSKEIQKYNSIIQKNEEDIRELKEKIKEQSSMANYYKNEFEGKQNALNEKLSITEGTQMVIDSFLQKIENFVKFEKKSSLNEKLKFIENFVIETGKSNAQTNEKNQKLIENLKIEMKSLKKKYDASITELELKSIQISNMEKIIEKKNESFNSLKEENSKLHNNIKKLYDDNTKILNSKN